MIWRLHKSTQSTGILIVMATVFSPYGGRRRGNCLGFLYYQRDTKPDSRPPTYTLTRTPRREP